jgi:hypothetical protein
MEACVVYFTTSTRYFIKPSFLKHVSREAVQNFLIKKIQRSKFYVCLYTVIDYILYRKYKVSKLKNSVTAPPRDEFMAML